MRLHSAEAIQRLAPQIAVQAMRSSAMPPNNITGMEVEEPRLLAAWLSAR